MDTIKKIFSMIPLPVWIGGGILLALILYWKAGDIGNWYEKRKQDKFDQADAAKQVEIDKLHTQLNEALTKMREAEAREQIKAQEADMLRQLIDARGGKIEEQQKAIDEALAKYKDDTAIIEAAGRGEISKFDLCKRQCDDSAGIGYPCRKNYCDQYIGK